MKITESPVALEIYNATGRIPRHCEACGKWKSPTEWRGKFKRHGNTCADCRIAPKRECLPARLRFSILQRDKFTCQYCGRSVPSVVLHVDHILPLSSGGTNNPTNLVAACADCNLGKFTLTVLPPKMRRPSTKKAGKKSSKK